MKLGYDQHRSYSNLTMGINALLRLSKIGIFRTQIQQCIINTFLRLGLNETGRTKTS